MPIIKKFIYYCFSLDRTLIKSMKKLSINFPIRKYYPAVFAFSFDFLSRFLLSDGLLSSHYRWFVVTEYLILVTKLFYCDCHGCNKGLKLRLNQGVKTRKKRAIFYLILWFSVKIPWVEPGTQGFSVLCFFRHPKAR